MKMNWLALVFLFSTSTLADVVQENIARMHGFGPTEDYAMQEASYACRQELQRIRQQCEQQGEYRGPTGDACLYEDSWETARFFWPYKRYGATYSNSYTCIVRK